MKLYYYLGAYWLTPPFYAGVMLLVLILWILILLFLMHKSFDGFGKIWFILTLLWFFAPMLITAFYLIIK